MPWLRVAVLAACAAFAATLYERTPLHRYVETRASLPLLFELRERLGAAPSLDPRLKILTYDDTTFTKLRAPDLSLSQWRTLLTALDAKRPRAVFIDQIFGMTPRMSGGRVKIDEAIAAIGKIETPIVSAAYVAHSPSKLRRRLDVSGGVYELKNYFFERQELMRYGLPPLVQRLGWRAYGPNPDMARALKDVGHVLDGGRGYAAGVVQIGPATVVPHMALLGAGRPSFQRGRLTVDEHVVPTNAGGEIVVNFASPRAYYKHARRLLPFLDSLAAGKELDGVEPGDTVLILPAMFTGNSDFTETPVGPMPGGFVIASLLNSRLTKNWVTPLAASDGPTFLAVALGVTAALLASGYLAFGAMLLAVLMQLGGVVLLFSYGGLLTSMTAPVLGLGLGASAVMAERYRVRERLLKMLRALKLENEELHQEIDQAAQVARVFIPATPPTWSGISIGAFHQPLTPASGDWYSFATSASGRYCHFVMCDISGHGAQAAIVVSTCKTVLSLIVAESPARLESEQFAVHYATLLNRTLLSQGEGRHTATFIGVTIDREASLVHCLLAGHPRAIFCDGTRGQSGHLGKAGSLLGLTGAPQLTLVNCPFRPGDSLLAYTDGVPLPRTSAKVHQIFETYRHLAPDSAAKFIAVEAAETQAVRAEGAGPSGLFVDDASLVWFRWRTAEEEAMLRGGEGRGTSKSA